MTYSQFKNRAGHFLRKQLSLTNYIDVQAADENIRKNIPFRGPNIYILFVAIVIASVGLNVNSIPVIIGAMLISPLMSPIIGFGLGLGTNDARFGFGNQRCTADHQVLAPSGYHVRGQSDCLDALFHGDAFGDG